MLESLFNKVAGLMACNFIKKETPLQFFPENIAKILRTLFVWNISGGCFCGFSGVF